MYKTGEGIELAVSWESGSQMAAKDRAFFAISPHAVSQVNSFSFCGKIIVVPFSFFVSSRTLVENTIWVSVGSECSAIYGGQGNIRTRKIDEVQNG